MIRAIIFDFDGVIVDSIDIKTQAFAEMYAEFGRQIVEKVVSHHLLHGGISRFEKIRFYHRTLLGIDLSDAEVQSFASEFHNKIIRKVVNARYIPGTYEFLAKYYKQYRFFISSGTPELEMKQIVDLKGLDKFFIKVYGSPASKIDHIESILESFSLSRSETVYIGDSISDKVAASKTGIRFIGRGDNASLLRNERYFVNDLSGLHEYIGKLTGD